MHINYILLQWSIPLTVAFSILKIDQYMANTSTWVQGLAFLLTLPSTVHYKFKVITYNTVNRDEKFVAYLLLGGEKNKPHKDDVFRSFTAVADYLHFFDENTTVNGSVVIVDYGHWTMKVEAYLPMQERNYAGKTFQVCTFCVFSSWETMIMRLMVQRRQWINAVTHSMARKHTNFWYNVNLL